MKGKLLRVFTMIVYVIVFCDICSGESPNIYFSPYRDPEFDKVGILFGDEVCIAPIFDDVHFDKKLPLYCDDFPYIKMNPYISDVFLQHKEGDIYDTHSGFFAYKENGKWGISSIYCNLTEPIYDSIKFSYPFAIVRNNGKEGLVYYQGQEIMPCKYDSICNELVVMDADWSYNDYKHPMIKENYYFLAYDNGKPLIIDALGTIVLDKFDVTKLMSNDYKQRKKIFKKVMSIEDNRAKKDVKVLNDIKKHLTPKQFSIVQPAHIGGSKYIPVLIKDIDNVYYLIMADKKVYKLPTEYNYEAFEVQKKDDYSQEGYLIPFLKIFQNGKCGVMAYTGKLILPVQFDSVNFYAKTDCFEAKKGDVVNKYSIINGDILDVSNKVIMMQYKNQIEKEGALRIKLDSSFPDVGIRIEVDSIPQTITEQETNLTVLVNDTPEDVRNRMGFESLVVYAREIIESKESQNEPDDWEVYEILSSIITAAKAVGYNPNSDFMLKCSEFAEHHRKKYVDNFIKAAKEAEYQSKLARISAICDAVSSVSGSLLNTASQVIDASNSSSYGQTSVVSSQDRSSSGTKGASSDKYNISEQQNYNSDKRAYSRYDGMLSEYYAGNRKASASEVSNWKSSMRKLRSKWESKGKSFPHFPNEDK